MSLTDQIKQDLPAALKAGETLRTSVLRMLLSELNYKKIELQRELTDVDVTGVISREVKKRREAIESYNAGGRKEQAQTEQQELELLSAYLPKQLSETEIRAEIKKIIAGLGVEERANFGQVMKVVAPAFKGKADGSVVAGIVKELL